MADGMAMLSGSYTETQANALAADLIAYGNPVNPRQRAGSSFTGPCLDRRLRHAARGLNSRRTHWRGPWQASICASTDAPRRWRSTIRRCLCFTRLRDQFDLHGPKFGCGLGQCGACTVIINGEAVRSCQLPVSSVQGREITTLEGLGTPENLSPVQAAFVAEQAAQCGYCTNGMIMTATALLAKNPRPTEAEAREALAGNLCRCGTHVRVLGAVMRVAANGTGGR